jgi:acyl-homoserine lactone acylase PvdQ
MTGNWGIARVLIVAAAAWSLLVAAPARAATPQPYGTNDAGGFRNVLPPGENGLDTAVQLATFQLNGSYPEHWMDQQPLYNNLIYAAPTLTDAQVPSFYKDATFGVKPGEVASTTVPPGRPGVTILRDTPYGIPHVYGDTSEDVAFGAGYAGAQDRLFLMDVLRHTGEASLSSFVGGSASNRAMDHAQWQTAPYTDADLQRQIDLAPQIYGAAGVQLQQLLQAYVDGINAYIQQATQPLNVATMLPGEYAALGKLPQPWTGRDVVAEASLIGGIFGRGGGRELDSAQTLQALQHRFGSKKGARAWVDFREANDPKAPTTVLKKRFPYETAKPFSKRGLALPDPGSVSDAPVAPAVSRQGAGAGPFADLGAQLMDALQFPHASNWELVSARESQTGHPIGVLGPQVGYYLPQILMEEDLHGPGYDAEGATFPGVNLFVLLGHGRDYAWSATTATSDNVDTFAEVLCQDDFHYLYKGQCLPMDKLDRTNSWLPSAVDQTPPGSETLTAYRTVHGIVFARGTVHGRKVAFVSARTTYGHEADSSLFFQRMNDPQLIHGPGDFRTAAALMNFAFNWSYIDSKHIAYQLTGWYPQRAKRTSPDFPILGTGQFDWKGYDPSLHEATWLPQRKIPHATDQAYLVSWNNKQARGWAAADDKFAFGPIYRIQLIADKVRSAIKGRRKATLAQVVQAMELSATQDIRAIKVLPIVLRALGKPKDTQLQGAIAELKAWRAAGGHRADMDRDGVDEFTPAIELMDAWWPKLVRAEFNQTLGNDAYKAVEKMLPDGDFTGRDPSAPDFADGWYGDVLNDLRDLYSHPRHHRGRHSHTRAKQAYSRVYCGGGSRGRCRAALRASLRDALTVTPQQLYGFGDCESNPQPSCFDRNRSTNASGLSIDPQPFQNRPTFQQAVSIPTTAPR